jgi:hypothetical protein
MDYRRLPSLRVFVKNCTTGSYHRKDKRAYTCSLLVEQNRPTNVEHGTANNTVPVLFWSKSGRGRNEWIGSIKACYTHTVPVKSGHYICIALHSHGIARSGRLASQVHYVYKSVSYIVNLTVSQTLTAVRNPFC